VPAAIVFAAAPLAPTDRLRSRLASLRDPFVVAADDGATTALAFGLTPDVVVGDLDSLDPATRSKLTGVLIEEYPRDKDVTDGQLAIVRALQASPTELLLLGFLGGPRLDQELANVLLLTSLDTPAVLVDDGNEATVLRQRGEQVWTPERGEIVSLIPLGGDVTGVRTEGLRWALNGETLRFGDTRGISNEPAARVARVTIESGLLLVTRHFKL
jgi:thiamine pyrophosphokinase